MKIGYAVWGVIMLFLAFVMLVCPWTEASPSRISGMFVAVVMGLCFLAMGIHKLADRIDKLEDKKEKVA